MKIQITFINTRLTNEVGFAQIVYIEDGDTKKLSRTIRTDPNTLDILLKSSIDKTPVQVIQFTPTLALHPTPAP